MFANEIKELSGQVNPKQLEIIYSNNTSNSNIRLDLYP
jgi:hypothetical protein